MRSFCIIDLYTILENANSHILRQTFALCSPENDADWPKRDYKKGKETFKGFMDLPRLWLKRNYSFDNLNNRDSFTHSFGD